MKLILLFLLAILVYNVVKAAKFLKGITRPGDRRPKEQNKGKPYSNLDIKDAEFKDVDE